MSMVFKTNASGRFQLFDPVNQKWHNVVFDNVQKPNKRNVSSVIRIYSCQAVEKDGKWGIYSVLNRSQIVPCMYDTIIYDYHERFNDGWVVAQNNKWGLYSTNGEIILPCEYDEIVSAPYAWIIKRNGLWGAYDNKTKTFGLPCLYEKLIVTAHEYTALKGKEWITITRE